jgi:Domain of unknown function (DUF4124)
MPTERNMALVRASVWVNALAMLVSITVCEATVSQTLRWKDERGVVHYGDTVPPRYKDSATVEMTSSAVPIRANAAALTPQQRAEQEARRTAEALEAKKREEFERVDRALMSKYANPTELARAHAQDLIRYDDELNAHTFRTQTLSERAFELLKSRPKFNNEQRAELSSLSNELSQMADILERKLIERRAIEGRQKAERARFEALMGQGKRTQSPS